MKQDQIIQSIELSVKALAEYEKSIDRMNFGQQWEKVFQEDTSKLIDKNFKINVENLTHFRGKELFLLNDRPQARFRSFYSSSRFYYTVKSVLNRISGNQRGKIREALDLFKSIEKEGFLDILKKYPNPDIGRPLNLKHKGCVFTWCFLRYIYFIGLLKRYLIRELKSDSIILDIGSSYGAFSGLLKQNMPDSHHVLVDLPGQLILAHYYLATLFPDAKIADFKEISEAKEIDRDFIKRFDFVLVPTSMYDKLIGYSADLITNFTSLSEMSREWFNKYINSQVFRTAPLFFTVNRYDAYPTYGDITILDYPLADYKKIHMRTSSPFKNHYGGSLIFWYKMVRYPSEIFEFVGRRNEPKA